MPDLNDAGDPRGFTSADHLDARAGATTKIAAILAPLPAVVRPQGNG